MIAKTQSFMERLKRHHVFRVASWYATVAWVLILAANQVFPNIGLTRAAIRVLIVALALGFPVAVALGWTLITPSYVEPKTLTRWRRIRWRLGGAISLIAILLVTVSGVYLWRVNERHPGEVYPGNAAIPAKSIAVLPFENLSPDPDNAYFAAGMQDMILTKLAGIGDMKVISRTSTQKYPSHPDDLKAIGESLGVATILEGSVQRVGNQVLINVQLIDASSDDHVWAEAYTRTLDNIFGVEGEVAQDVAETLKAKLAVNEQRALVADATRNPGAYNAYLRGLALAAQGVDHDIDPKELDAYREAVRLDPAFAQAWARLGIRLSLYYQDNATAETDADRAEAKAAAERAMALAPDLGDSWKAVGMYRYYLLKDYAGALKALAEAGAREPGNSEVLMYMGLIERRQGNWQASLAHFKQAMNLDPHNLTVLLGYSNTAQMMKDFTDAQTVLDRALTLAPDNLFAQDQDVYLHISEGDLDGALALVKDGLLKPAQLNQASVYALIYDKQYDRVRTLVNAALAATDPKDLDGQADWLGVLSDIAYATGDMAGVRTESGKALKLHLALRAAGAADADILSSIAADYAGMGDREQALAAIEKALALNAGNALDYPEDQVIHAQILVRFGETQAALKLLEYLLKTPDGLSAGEMKFDPSWNPIRNDPGFQALLKKYP